MYCQHNRNVYDCPVALGLIDDPSWEAGVYEQHDDYLLYLLNMIKNGEIDLIEAALLYQREYATNGGKEY